MQGSGARRSFPILNAPENPLAFLAWAPCNLSYCLRCEAGCSPDTSRRSCLAFGGLATPPRLESDRGTHRRNKSTLKRSQETRLCPFGGRTSPGAGSPPGLPSTRVPMAAALDLRKKGRANTRVAESLVPLACFLIPAASVAASRSSTWR